MDATELRSYYYMVLSSILYGVGGITEFMVLKAINFGTSLILFAIGGFISLPSYLYFTKVKTKPKVPKYWLFSCVASFAVILYVLILYLGYLRFTLASMYSLVDISALIFLLIDLFRYHTKMRPKILALLVIGVTLVSIGAYFAETENSVFQVSAIPFALAIATLAGVGYYLQYYRIHKYPVGSKVLFEPVFLLLFGLLFSPSFAFADISVEYLLLGLLSGIVFVWGSVLELAAVSFLRTEDTEQAVVKRNFINDFEYADVLIVLAGSILLGSYYPIEVFGGILIVSGLLIIDLIR
jgi:drug/metabolite transporter (DMT)-like permease